MINLNKLKNVISSTINKIKNSNDSVSKFSYLIEGIMELFE